MFTILFLLGILCFCIEFLIMKRLRYTKGYGVEENRAAIETVEVIRVAPIVENPSNPHPLLAKVK